MLCYCINFLKMNFKLIGVILIISCPLLGAASYLAFKVWSFWLASDSIEPNQSALYLGMLILLLAWLACIAMLIAGVIFLFLKKKQ